ncbi:unnamed protein product [Amoebophrya sp. A120]|nr:unnamed protein product [Amoebophrya sp. A120]|eukprot:GSA120T00005394001.1
MKGEVKIDSSRRRVGKRVVFSSLFRVSDVEVVTLRLQQEKTCRRILQCYSFKTDFEFSEVGNKYVGHHKGFFYKMPALIQQFIDKWHHAAAADAPNHGDTSAWLGKNLSLQQHSRAGRSLTRRNIPIQLQTPPSHLWPNGRGPPRAKAKSSFFSEAEFSSGSTQHKVMYDPRKEALAEVRKKVVDAKKDDPNHTDPEALKDEFTKRREMENAHLMKYGGFLGGGPSLTGVDCHLMLFAPQCGWRYGNADLLDLDIDFHKEQEPHVVEELIKAVDKRPRMSLQLQLPKPPPVNDQADTTKGILNSQFAKTFTPDPKFENINNVAKRHL